MRNAPANSFFRFVIGFFVFISIFFGVTFAVQKVASSQQAQQEAAAAEAEMLK